jgi:thiol-disulfide isomerase/thioredoxin
MLSGQLKGFSNQAEVEDMSEYQYLLPPTSDRMVVPDVNGHFSLKFKVSAPNYYRLGRNALYLSPGDQLEVYIDKGDPRLSTFKGPGAEANTYLKNTPFPKGGSFLEAGKQVKENPEATIAAVEELALQRSKELALVKKITPEFRRLEMARIKADLINGIYSGETYGVYKLKLKDTAAKVYTENYKKAIEPVIAKYSKNFTDPSLMKLVVYRDIAEEVIKQGGRPADIQVIRDWYAASALVKDMQKLSDKTKLKTVAAKTATVKTVSYRLAAEKMLTRLMAFGKGDPAVDFVATNISGDNVSLSSLKGRVIYVDLWATWCGPCMEEMPHFEALKAKYKDNPNIAFVSLSIDDTDVPWKKSVESRKADGFQWLINRAKLQAYNIVGIPRTLLIDKDFKIMDMDAPMPSQAIAVKAIDALLNNK